MEPKAFFVDKPEGIGSTDVVRQFKRNLPKPFKKIGHFGTLDPFATGLLIIGINGAQRLSDFLHADFPKTYRSLGKLGVASDTGDKTGELNEEELPSLKLDLTALEMKWGEQFSTEYMQKPPMYSATKHKGKNLYEYAREGIKIEKEPVLRKVHQFKIHKIELPYIDFEVTVSSGTYIRVLFEDMAKDLGTVGHLEQLRRVGIGPHSVDSANVYDQWPAEGMSVLKLYPAKEETLESPEILKKYLNGVQLNKEDVVQQLSNGERCWMKSPQGAILGLAKRVDEKIIVEFNFPTEN